MRKLWYIIPLAAVLMLSGCSKDNTEEQAQRGLEAMEQGNYENAIKDLTGALEGDCDLRQVYRGLGIAYLELNEYDKSIDAFQLALSLSDGIPENMDFDMNYYLAQAYMKNNQADEAVKVYNAILNLKSKSKDAYYYRGMAYLILGEKEEAIEDFAEVTAADPKNFDYYIDIYAAMYDAGYKEDAKNYLAETFQKNESYMSDFDKGRCYFYLENYSEARISLEKAKDMSNVESILMLGRVYEQMEDYNYAASVYNSYLTAKGDSAKVYNQLGLCKMKTADYEEALAAFKAGLRLEERDWEQTLLFNEATAYEYMGDFKSAAKAMASYLEQYPDDEEAKREYEFLKTR